MSTAIPGRHIEGMVRAFSHTDPSVPAGWTREAWVSYCGDPDGAWAPFRSDEFAYPPDTTPTALEVLSRES